MKSVLTLVALLTLAACQAVQQPGAKQPAAKPSAPHQSVPEPSATSDQAAATLVETYYALLEQKDYAAAGRLWGDAQPDIAAFKAKLGDLAEIHAEIGKPGPSEGACGSIYIEIPVRVRSRLVGGVSRLQTGKAVLRRVNNVDGATPAQLRWHIASIDLTPA